MIETTRKREQTTQELGELTHQQEWSKRYEEYEDDGIG